MSKLDGLRIDAPVSKPRRRRRFPWLPVVVVLFVAVITLWLQRDKLAALVPNTVVPVAESNESVTTAASPTRTGPAGSISAAGYLEVIPPGPIVVSALVSGQIKELAVVAGQAVSEGDVVAKLDSSLLQRQASILARRVELAQRKLEREQAGFRVEEIAQVKAALAAAEARLGQAIADWERAQEMYAAGASARQALDARQADYEAAEARVNENLARLRMFEAGARTEDIRIAEAELNAARAELSEVSWEIAQCTITAPSSGVVLEQFTQPGGWVTPGTDNPHSGALISIFDPSQIQAWVDINQRDSASLYVGQQVELSADSAPQRLIAGVVSRIMPQANLQKNTVQVKISIPFPPADFRPELSVKAVFLSEENAEATEQPTHEGSTDDLQAQEGA